MKEQLSKMNRTSKWFAALTWLLGLGLLTTSGLTMAQTTAVLESPSASAFVRSGVGLIRGWACTAKKIEISIDDGERLVAGYGTLRTDTAQICGGKVDTGFGLTFNWNGIGDGIHNVRAFADGNEFANVNFTVTTLGKDFITGLVGNYVIPNFPLQGKATPLLWSTANQNFLVGERSAPTAALAVAQVTGIGTAVLESPGQDSYESGVGLIRGWACDAKKVEVSINGGSRQATAYGTLREDTKPVCGDTNNGFGLTFNWSTLSNGTHRIQAFADDVEFANVTFNTTNLGADFLTGLNKEIPLEHFPSAGQRTLIRWSTPDQNFTIAETSATPPKVALVSLINDLRNTFAVSGVGIDSNKANTNAVAGSASSNTTGVRAAKNALGLPTQLQGIAWGDSRTNQNADISLRADGLPNAYSDSKGVKAEFSNLTDNSITVTFKDGSGKPIGDPVNAPISIDQLLALQEVAKQVFAQGQSATAAAGRQLAGTTLLPAGYAPNAATPDLLFTMNKLLTNVFWHGSQSAGELVCAVGQAANQVGIKTAVAQTACQSPLITALRQQLTIAPRQALVTGDANQAVDPLAQRSLLFVSDVLDVPCMDGDISTCLLEPAMALQERQAAVPPPLPPEGTITSILVTAEAGTGGSISPTRIWVVSGAIAAFVVTPDSGYRIAEVSGCNGSLSGNTYTTGAISAECVVRASFALRERITVTAVASAGGSITPTSQTVYVGDTARFAIRPNAGYRIESVTGCNGSLAGETYTTGPISQACTVNASFGYASSAQ